MALREFKSAVTTKERVAAIGEVKRTRQELTAAKREATTSKKAADAIDKVHGINKINAEVEAAKNDPQVVDAIGKWRDIVNPMMDK
jgi:RecG-like helicase